MSFLLVGTRTVFAEAWGGEVFLYRPFLDSFLNGLLDFVIYF